LSIACWVFKDRWAVIAFTTFSEVVVVKSVLSVEQASYHIIGKHPLSDNTFSHISVRIRAQQGDFNPVLVFTIGIRQSHTDRTGGVVTVLIKSHSGSKVRMDHRTLCPVGVRPYIHAIGSGEVSSTWRTEVSEDTELDSFSGFEVKEQVTIFVHHSVIKTKYFHIDILFHPGAQRDVYWKRIVDKGRKTSFRSRSDPDKVAAVIVRITVIYGEVLQGIGTRLEFQL